MSKVYILGGAQTDFARNWQKEGKGMISLLKEIIPDGLMNAHLSFEDVMHLNKKNRIACFVGNFIAEKFIDQGHLGAFLTEIDSAFYGVPSARYEAACASSSVAIDAAATKIQTSEYDVCIVVGWELMKLVKPVIVGNYLGRAAYYEKEGKDIDFPFPRLFGQLVDEILKKYPELDEKRLMDTLARISVINYENARRNPLAQTRKLSMSYENASTRGSATNPLIGGRLAASDCSQITDGAVVVVLASEKYVNEHKIEGKPIIKGYGHRTAPILFEKKMIENKSSNYILPWTRQACVDAYQRANLQVKNIDVFEIHDCFTSSEYVEISALGLTHPGKEYEAIEDGTVAKIINPSGGLIGCGHPVGASGARMLLDLYKQVTNNAGNYQVDNAKNGMMLNIGGSATTNYAFIIGKE